MTKIIAMKQTLKTGFAALLLLLAISCKKESSSIQSSGIKSVSSTRDALTDASALAGNTVRIGSQVWMTKNLDVSRYRNGDKIPQVKNRAKWAALTTGAWCWHNNDSSTGAVYGKIYNWYAVNDARGLAPEGWHIPSDSEWTILTTFLGGDAVAGGKMKETGTAHWLSPNTDATNSSGFTGVAAGNRYNTGSFLYFGMYGWGWSSSESSGLAWYRRLNYNDGGVFRGAADKRDGISVRCIRDN